MCYVAGMDAGLGGRAHSLEETLTARAWSRRIKPIMFVLRERRSRNDEF